MDIWCTHMVSLRQTVAIKRQLHQCRQRGQERLRLFKHRLGGLLNAVFEQNWFTRKEKDEKGAQGESRQTGSVNIRLMVCSVKSMCSTRPSGLVPSLWNNEGFMEETRDFPVLKLVLHSLLFLTRSKPLISFIYVFPLIFALPRIDPLTQDAWAQVQSLRNPKSPLRSRSCQAKINQLLEQKQKT